MSRADPNAPNVELSKVKEYIEHQAKIESEQKDGRF